MVEEGIKVLIDLGALDRIAPSSPFGAFDPKVWGEFGRWLITAGLLGTVEGTRQQQQGSDITQGMLSDGGSQEVPGPHEGDMGRECDVPLVAPVQQQPSQEIVEMLCCEEGGIWTNRFRS